MSEFGKGLIIPLIKFYQHFGNEAYSRIRTWKWFSKRTKKDQAIIISDNPPSSLNYGIQVQRECGDFIKRIKSKSPDAIIEDELRMWVYGAADHLYEIECPAGNDWNEIRERVNNLRDVGLDMRNPHMGSGWDNFSFEAIQGLHKMVKELTVLIDKKIGLSPDWGEY